MKQKTTILIACCLWSIACIAQQYPFVQYTPKDGLVNSRVRKAYQDSRGRMYFLTYSGLSVYDGAKFRNYTTQNGLASNLLNDILEIGNDSFLIATNTNEVNILSGGKISPLKTDNNFTPLVNHFYRRGKNEVYASSDDGLFLYKDNRFVLLNTSPIIKSATAAPYFGTIAGFGNYLVIGSNDLKGNRGLFLYDIKAARLCDIIPDRPFSNIAKDESNRVWISVPDHLYHLDTIALLTGRLLLVEPAAPYRKTKDYPTGCMAFDKQGIWLSFAEKKLLHFSETGETLQIPLPELLTVSGLRNIFIDRENTMWLCNDGAGVFKLVNTNLRISESPIGKSASEYFRSFCQKNTTWYTSRSTQLSRKTPAGLTEFTSNLTQPPYIFDQTGNRLLANDYRNIYEGNIHEESRRILFNRIISLPDMDNFGKTIHIDPNGYIIAALRSGINVWKNNVLVFRLLLEESDLIEGLAFDKHNLLWVATRYKEPVAYSLNPGDDTHYLQPVYTLPGKSEYGSPRSFLIDKESLIWLGTRNNGVFVYKQEEEQWKKLYHFHTGNGLMEDFVTALACDSFNNILVGTQTGLDRLVKDTGNTYRIENLTKSNNFFAYIDQVWTDAGNNCYALTNAGGLLEFSAPVKVKTDFIPQVLIEELRVNAQVAGLKKTVFPFKENNISFTVAAPSFIDERQISYSYLLEGSGNSHWSDTTAGNSVINLVNLPAGKYLLKVKAFFPSTPYPPSEMSYAFAITPPWWQTWWFRILAALSIIGLLVLAIRFYYRNKLRQQKAILEKKQAIEKERTRIATDMHDDLGAGLSRIKFLSETIGIKKQKQLPIEEDISKIREYSHEMIDKMGEIVWALNEKNDSLSDLLSYTRSYAAEYLSQNGIQCTVNLPEQIPSLLVSGEFRRNIFLAVKEILHNVVKHAQANSVTMNITLDKKITIEVQDDGTGFDRENIRPFSNGLVNIEKRMKDIAGTMHIQSRPGTMVRLEVPLPL